ncbi:uncharacterized protein LOC132202689 [Neocloeon triangulifer]|uniref:uncharacterized protein LOC132202689 n=1 Tax=Neocloeon triangulifer TaxID=2078957 RepID=UPI00286EFBD3|nr:uncharacterized protein LOC132202689 [Neocloeon triangulifer]
MKALVYLLFISFSSLISAQMPWEIPSLPEDSDEDVNRNEFECYAKCFNVFPSTTAKENNNTITKSCERKVGDMRLLRVAATRMYISKMAKTWYQAYHFCRKYGMNLAPILNPQAESAFTRLIVKHGQDGEGFWMGATDMAQDGRFYWMVGGYDFDKNSIKLVNANDKSGDCVELRIVERAEIEETEWAKSDCMIPKRFACSFPTACIVQNGTSST